MCLTAALQIALAKIGRPERGRHDSGAFWYSYAQGAIFNQQAGDGILETFKFTFADLLQIQDFELRHALCHLEPNTALYQRDANVGTARVAEGPQELHSPRQGHYFLHPLSRTDFRIEDNEFRPEVTPDGPGTAARMRVWPRAGADPYEYVRGP